MILGGAWVALSAATGAAAAFGAASALQHRVAGQVPDAQGLRPRQILRFAAATVSHPLWLLSSTADLAGLALHVVALRAGALAIVQTALVSGVVFALALEQILARRRPRTDHIVFSCLLVAGLGVFLAAAGLPDRPDTLPGRGGTCAALAGGLGVVGFCAMVARRRPGPPAAALLGTAAGVAFAGTAALIKVCARLAGDRPAVLIHRWPLYALATVGGVGLLLNQLAFQAGPLSASLPAITVVDPLVSVALGLWLFHEPLRHSPDAVLVQGAALALASGAAIVLAGRPRRAAVDAPDAPPPLVSAAPSPAPSRHPKGAAP